MVFNCHCRSCVTAAKFVEEKHTTSSGTSAFMVDGGGVAKALFKLDDIEFVTVDGIELSSLDNENAGDLLADNVGTFFISWSVRAS